MFSEFKIDRILVPTDFSETANLAINHALDVAKRFNAEISLIHVLEKGAYQGIFAPSRKTEFNELESAQARLQEDANRIEEEHGINVTQEVVSGRIYEEIVRAADEVGADMIVMGTHGASGWEEFFVGSNAFKVVTQSSCPVLSIQEQAKNPECLNIILPLDSTPETRQKVRYAVTMAKKFGSTIHIASLLTEDNEEIRYDFEKKVKQITEYLDREGIPHTVATLVGSNLATMTMNFAESKGGNLIVMMTEQESNLTGFLMGPFAQQIVNHSRIPVLSISPEDLTNVDDSFHALG
ncbi:MAG: universal stress protein [Flavobacteriales bacterium]|nr:universal stress protein [Flavobacteriales bacterium]